MTNPRTAHEWPADVRTLAIDVGGSGFKASVLDAEGNMLTDRVRMDTPYPCPPSRFIESLKTLTAELPEYHRVAVGFPGLVRNGRVKIIVSLSRSSYLGPHDPELAAQWADFDLASALSEAFALPVKVANDADVQACAVAKGNGLEFVMTLGTGCGTALFNDGVLLPHLELGHAPLRTGATVEQLIGNAARKEVGNKEWIKRVLEAIAAYDGYLFFDHIYIGGGNAKKLSQADLDGAGLSGRATLVPNSAGITGGVRIWDLDA